MLRSFDPPGWPAMPHLSQATEVSSFQRMLFVSGQVGVNPDGTVGKTVAEQARAAIANVTAVLASADMEVSDIAKATIYLTDESLIGEFSAAAAGALPSPPPATTLLIVKGLAAPGLLVEIEAVAVK